MTNVVGFFLIAIIFCCCSSGKPDKQQKPKVDERIKDFKIDVKKDQAVADYITTYYDSVEVKERNGLLLLTYFLGPQQNFVSFDSLRHVIAIRRMENGKTTFLREYYPNGQAKGEVSFEDGKVKGVAIYYREDGTISAVIEHGLDDGRTSIGREYDENGRQTAVVEYDAVGNYLKERVKSKDK